MFFRSRQLKPATSTHPLPPCQGSPVGGGGGDGWGGGGDGWGGGGDGEGGGGEGLGGGGGGGHSGLVSFWQLAMRPSVATETGDVAVM